jgi:hypothetical protein
MSEDKTPIGCIARGKLVVHILPGADPQHLRDMAAELERAAKEMEEKA